MELKKIECMTCGSNSFHKDGEFMVCDFCGTRYSKESAQSGEKLFDIAGGTLRHYNGEAREIEVPESVIAIADRAFEGLQITSVKLPGTLERIGDRAFRNCMALREMEIPESVKEIGESAFEGCRRLEKVILPDSLERIPGKLFYGCSSLGEIGFPQNLKMLDISALKDSGITEITIPLSLTTVSAVKWGHFTGEKIHIGYELAVNMAKAMFADDPAVEDCNKTQLYVGDRPYYDLFRVETKAGLNECEIYYDTDIFFHDVFIGEVRIDGSSTALASDFYSYFRSDFTRLKEEILASVFTARSLTADRIRGQKCIYCGKKFRNSPRPTDRCGACGKEKGYALTVIDL